MGELATIFNLWGKEGHGRVSGVQMVLVCEGKVAWGERGYECLSYVLPSVRQRCPTAAIHPRTEGGWLHRTAYSTGPHRDGECLIHEVARRPRPRAACPATA